MTDTAEPTAERSWPKALLLHNVRCFPAADVPSLIAALRKLRNCEARIAEQTACRSTAADARESVRVLNKLLAGLDPREMNDG